MHRLRALAMQQGWIYETIVSTYCGGEPHAAPIGVRAEGLDTLRMEIFDSSQTLTGILDTGLFTVGFPSDVTMFHAALFTPGLLVFEEARSVSAPVVVGCVATVELALREAIPAPPRVRISGEVVRAEVQVESPANLRLFNRAEGLLVESLILATRLQYLDEETVRRSLEENRRVIRKVAPGSIWETKMADLMGHIGGAVIAPPPQP